MFGQRVSCFGIRFLYTVGGRSRFRGIQNLLAIEASDLYLVYKS